MDELWSYCSAGGIFNKKKAQKLWVFIAFEAKTKFWISFELGSRTTNTAKRLVKQVSECISTESKNLMLVTTDKLSCYVKALETYFCNRPYAYLSRTIVILVRDQASYKIQIAHCSASGIFNKKMFYQRK
jgi:IS1 family transposase